MDGTRRRFKGLLRRGPRATGGAGLTDGCDEARLIPQRMPCVGSAEEEREIHCEANWRKRRRRGSALSTREVTIFREAWR